MRLIDADALANCKFHGWANVEITPSDVNAESYKRGWNDVVDAIIEEAPTVDAIEVVHCKDCKYWQDNQEGHYPNDECPWDKGETPDADDYCSYGERK